MVSELNAHHPTLVPDPTSGGKSPAGGASMEAETVGSKRTHLHVERAPKEAKITKVRGKRQMKKQVSFRVQEASATLEAEGNAKMKLQKGKKLKLPATKALKQLQRKGGRRNYVTIDPGGQLDLEIQALADAVRLRGKSPRTRKQYSSGEKHWRHLRKQKGWPAYVTGLSPQTIASQAIYFAASEVKLYGLAASSLRSKFSAVRWMHVRDFHPDPFKDLATLTSWLSDYEKRSPPANPKLACPLSLLEYIVLHLSSDSLTAAVVEAAIDLGFWFLLRSIEYLADDDGLFDEGLSVCWNDIVFRKEGEVIPLSRIAEADEMTITVFSAKGSLHTCTRTLRVNPGSRTCVVAAHKKLYAAYVKYHGKPPRASDSPYRMENGQVLSRPQLSEVLKGAAMECGIPASRVASHSLRRGGSSAYAAAGVPDQDIMRFGRWTSDGYKVYVLASTCRYDAKRAA